MSFIKTLLSGLKHASNLAIEGLREVVNSDTVREGALSLATNAVGSLFNSLSSTRDSSLMSNVRLAGGNPQDYIEGIGNIAERMADSYDSVSEIVSPVLASKLLSSKTDALESISELAVSTNDTLVLLAEEAKSAAPVKSIWSRYNRVNNELETFGSGMEPGAFKAMQGKLDSLANSFFSLNIGSAIGYNGTVFLNTVFPWDLPYSRIEAVHTVENLDVGAVVLSGSGTLFEYTKISEATESTVVEDSLLRFNFDSTTINPAYSVKQKLKLMFSNIVSVDGDFYIRISVKSGTEWTVVTNRFVDVSSNLQLLEYVEFAGDSVEMSIDIWGIVVGVGSVSMNIDIVDIGVLAVPHSMTTDVTLVEYMDAKTGERKFVDYQDNYMDYFGKLQYDEYADPNFSLQAIWIERTKNISVTMLSEILNVVEEYYNEKYSYSLSDKWDQMGVDLTKLLQIPLWMMKDGPFFDTVHNRVFRDDSIRKCVDLFYSDLDALRDGLLFDRQLASQVSAANTDRC